jgi:transcriptional regulator with XRE-family HTH domain
MVLDTIEVSEAAAALGSRVRALRLQRGMTLKELGERAGLSHPFLSQLERGLARPSVASAERIASALGVSVGMLWSRPVCGGHATVVRRDAGERSPHHDGAAPGGDRRLPLNGAGMDLREWTGGSRRWPDEPQVEPGEIILYVARGRFEVDLDGEVHALDEGDTMIFDGSVPHRFRRAGGASTRVLRVASG